MTKLMINPVIDKDGNKRWYANGELHRLDGPAIEWSDGDKSWFFKDKLHRLDGPAVEYTNGYKSWVVDGRKVSGPLDLLEYGAKLEDIAEYLTPREIAQIKLDK